MSLISDIQDRAVARAVALARLKTGWLIWPHEEPPEPDEFGWVRHVEVGLLRHSAREALLWWLDREDNWGAAYEYSDTGIAHVRALPDGDWVAIEWTMEPTPLFSIVSGGDS